MARQKHKYKRYSQGGRFKDQGQGLRASVDAIRQRDQIQIDALKIQAGQQQEIDKQKIANLDRRARVREDNRNILKNLDDRIYQTKTQALQVAAEGDVQRLLGEAKLKEKESEFWNTFATEHSKTLGKVATQLGEFGQYLQAVNNDKWNRKNNPNKHDEFAAGMLRMYNINDEEMLNAYFKDQKKGNIPASLVVPMIIKQDRSNKRNAQIAVSEVIDNINTFTNVIHRTNAGRLNANNINLIYENAGYLLLYQRGIPFGSQEATRLLKTLNFKANAQKESWNNKTKFDTDQQAQRDFAAGYVAIHKQYTSAQPKDKAELEKALQIRHQQFSTLIEKSFYDLGNGRYGLKIFDKKTGFIIKVKGKGVGTVEKSATLEEAISNLVATNEARQDGLQKEIEQDNRKKIVDPLIQEWDNAIANEDWTLINSDEFQDKIKRVAMDPKFTKGGGTEELKRLYEIIGYGGKQIHGTLSDYLEIKGLVFAGRHREALNELLRSTNSNGNIPPGFEPLFKHAKLITELDGQGTSIKKAAIGLLDTSAKINAYDRLGQPEGMDVNKYNDMIRLIEHRILQVMLEDTSTDPAQLKFSNAQNKVAQELKEGENGRGLFAMRQATSYIPPRIDEKGKVVPGTDGEGYINRKDATNDEKKVNTTVGTYFLAVDNITIPGADINETNIEELFFKEGVSLQDALLINFNDPTKSILSRDQKRELVRMATLTQYGRLPEPIQVLVARAKFKNPKATTYDIMNQVLSAITATDEFKVYQGASWTPNHEDVTKKLLGTCTKSAKNNFTMCMTKRFAQDYDLKELNKQIAEGNVKPFIMTDKQVYDVLMKQRKPEQ